MKHPLIELFLAISAAMFGTVIHQIPPPDPNVFLVLFHEILQDGAWAGAIILGIKAIYDWVKPFSKKKRKN